MSIATPEGLELDLVLAGAGSRLVAALLDVVLKLAVLVAVAIVTVWTHAGVGVLVAVWALTVMVVWFGYDVLFELLASGRTPGKRWSGLRVLTVDGGAVTAGASVVRNLLRLVDSIPGMYLVGIILVAVTRRHQRLGDMVAGTVVVRERREVSVGDRRAVADRELPRSPMYDELATWDASAVTADEIATVQRFLERRHGLDPAARRRLAEDLASRLLPRVVGPGDGLVPERFLEDLVTAKSHRG